FINSSCIRHFCPLLLSNAVPIIQKLGRHSKGLADPRKSIPFMCQNCPLGYNIKIASGDSRGNGYLSLSNRNDRLTFSPRNLEVVIPKRNVTARGTLAADANVHR